MKTFLKIVGGVVLLVIALVAGAVTWLAVRKPESRAAWTEKIEATPERLARGQYLVEHVSDCLGCHSDHVIKFGVPVKPGTEGVGGYIFDKNIGVVTGANQDLFRVTYTASTDKYTITHFTNTISGVPLTTFGQVQGYSSETSPRQYQVAAKIIF